MTTIAGVRFHPNHIVKYVNACGMEVISGDWVEVETPSGPKKGIVVFGPNQLLHSSLDCPKVRLLRKIDRPSDQ